MSIQPPPSLSQSQTEDESSKSPSSSLPPSSSSWTISPWNPSVDDFSSLFAVWESTLSTTGWSLPESKLLSLLDVSNGTTFIARSSSPSSSSSSSSPILGFATTYTTAASSGSSIIKGLFALIAVLPSHQHRGIGTLLHETAITHLRQIVLPTLPLPHDQEPSASKKSLQLGSIFPRVFPGLPKNLGEDVKGWFERRGWSFGAGESIDLYRRVDGESLREEEGKELIKRLESQGVRYGPMEVGKEEELFAFQEKEFSTYAGWPEMFPQLVASGHIDDILCAYDVESGKIIGAIIASSDPSSPIQLGLAWPVTLGKQCGTISCVGVGSASRTKGTGLGMVFAATRYLAERGCDGILIDWVALPGMKGFYERAGYKEWRRYENEAVYNVC
ncbi:hypothetical protein BDY24DRAFT_432578 [Mrakia frigida]|uniref:uncharacterized protein n=1 Tax=Mrakia frigida TaxID=29902 RepID=UPI003FCC0081